MMNGETLSDVVCRNVNTSPHELAHRLSTSATCRHRPARVVTFSQGRYLETVSIQRLLATLANIGDATHESAPTHSAG